VRIVFFLILIVLYVAGVIFFKKHKAWLSYYLLGAFGLSLILIFSIRWFGIEEYIELAEMSLVHLIISLAGIESRVIGMQNIQISDSMGQIVLQMGVESSAILESSILIGLVSFYPAFTGLRKTYLLAVGLLFTALANLVRIVIIVGMVHFLGRGAMFLAHAVVGRLFFFACVIALFWYILTRPTVEEVSKMVTET
jgi:exosortase family protein XrtG